MHKLKIALRYLRKNRLTTSLNVLGLAVGMATFLLIQEYVNFERSYDQFYQDSEQVFRLNTLWGFEGEEERYATTPPPLAEVVRQQIPEVEAIVRVFYWSDFTLRPDNNHDLVFRETKAYAADEDFFKVLDYGLIDGDPATALKEPASVVLPKSAAIRYFGEEAFKKGDIVGRQLLGGKDASTPWNVTGVMEDQPENSHLQFEMVVSASSYPEDLYRNQVWTWNVMQTYLRTSANGGAEREQLQAKLKNIAEEYTLSKMSFAEANPEQLATVDFDYPLQPITDIHLTSNYLREMRPNGNATYVKLFMWAAYLVLFMAIINFINLATAQATRRAAETGVRKILGATYGSLIRQHLAESVVTGLLAGGVALGFVLAWNGIAAEWLGRNADLSVYWQPLFLLQLVALSLFTGLLAGAYPAFYLSRFASTDVLRGRQLKLISDRTLRNGLVVFQLGLSMVLIAGSWTIYQQVNYFQSKELGFGKSNLLVIENDREIDERKDAFKAELESHPGISAAGFSNGLPGQASYQMRDFRAEGLDDGTGINWILADDSFLPTLDVEMVDGRNFQARSSRDSMGIILNESAVRLLELENPVGHMIVKNEGRDDEERLQVIGVVQDFHLQSLHQEIQPLAFCFFQGFVFKDYISVRLTGEDVNSAIAHVEQRWEQFEPGVPLRYSFLDESYNQLFASEVQLGRLFQVFTGLAMLIAGLGLFGLVSLLLAERVREIGIRKVLGASLTQIVLLLSRQFIWLILIAFVIAVPLVWYSSTQWLQNFAYPIDFGPGPLLIAILGILALGLFTVGLRALRAATANPVESLRNE
ncbi:MAG: ABC transporter permease [Bacteroidota bacterium]